MWNFIKGVNPPIKKEKLKIKHYYSEYESSERVRSYSTEWEKDRPCSLFLASSTFKYAQNAGFAFKIFKIFVGGGGGMSPNPPSMFGPLCGPHR
jgi:hypothetical protein